MSALFVCLYVDGMFCCINLTGNIRVYCRVRPFLPGQTSNGASIMDEIVDNSLTIQTTLKNAKVKKTFTFNKAFGPSSTQGN